MRNSEVPQKRRSTTVVLTARTTRIARESFQLQLQFTSRVLLGNSHIFRWVSDDVNLSNYRVHGLFLDRKKPQENLENTVEPAVSAYGRWSLTRAWTILGQNCASLAYGNCRDLPRVLNVLFTWKVNSEKKFGSINWEISISCTT